MTYEEAIKVLRWALSRLEGHHYITDDYGTVDPSAKVNAFGMAIEALKMRIPMKPKVTMHSYINSDDGFFSRYFCPNCNLLICSEDKYGLFAGRKQEQCGRCGQAIDWEVSE